MKTKSALWWSCVIPSFAHVLSQINALATITTHKRERDYVENKTWRKWTSKCVKFNFSLDTQIKLFIQINPPSHFAGSNFFKICGTDLRGFYLDQIQWIFGKLPNGLRVPTPTLFSENYVALFLGGPKICNEVHSFWRDPPLFPPKNYRQNRN